jgi:hypothetical protein
LSSVVANQRQRVKIVETGKMIQMTEPDQVLLSGVLQSGAVASVHLKRGTTAGGSLESDLPRAIAGFHPRARRGFFSTLRNSTCGWLKAFAKESPPAQTLMWPPNATICLT